MREIDEHCVRLIGFHCFNLHFVIGLILLAEPEADFPRTNKTIRSEKQKWETFRDPQIISKRMRVRKHKGRDLLRNSRKAFSTLTAFSSTKYPP